MEEGRYRHSMEHEVSKGHVVRLHYDVVHAAKTHSIHDGERMEGLLGVHCESPGLLVLEFESEQQAKAVEGRVKEHHHVVGTHQCGGKVERSLLRRVLAVRRRGAQITFKTMPLTLGQVFRKANITFTSSALPSAHLPPSASSAVKSNSRSTRNIGSWLSSTWGSVERLGHDVEHAVGTVVHDALELVGGNLNVDQQFTRSLIDWNFDASTSRAQGVYKFDASIACTNCYAKFDAGLHFGLGINNYELRTMDISAFGQAKVGMGSNAALTGEAHFSVDVGTFSVPRITFVVADIPFTIKFTVPVAMGFDAQASIKSLSNQDMYGAGELRFGVRYDRSNDANLHPYTTHSLSFTGVTYKGVSGKASATAWVRPIILMDVNFLGGPQFALRPYAEALLDDSNGKCSRGAISTTINAGVQGVLGATLDLTVAGHNVIKKSMTPVTVLSQMYPISSGCLVEGFDAADAVVTRPSINGTNVTAVAFLTGAVWHGTQVLVNFTDPMCEEKYPHTVDYSLQLIKLVGSDAVFVLAGNAMDLVRNNTVPGYCMFQQLMAGKIDFDAKTLSLTDMLDSGNGVNYFQCSDDAFPVKASLQNFRWVQSPFHLAGVHPDQCLTSSLDAPDQQTMDKNVAKWKF